MRTLLLAILIGAALVQAVSDDDDKEWENFKAKYNKQYKTEKEEGDRKVIFLRDLKMVRDWNVQFQKGEVTYKQELDEFSDLTLEEIFKNGHYTDPKLLDRKRKEESHYKIRPLSNHEKHLLYHGNLTGLKL